MPTGLCTGIGAYWPGAYGDGGGVGGGGGGEGELEEKGVGEVEAGPVCGVGLTGAPQLGQYKEFGSKEAPHFEQKVILLFPNVAFPPRL